MTRKDGRWRLPRRAPCPICGRAIGRASYACPAPTFTPCHLRCVYLEMAVTQGEETK